ncbi:MAG: Mth938-like domain-containing protein [Sphingomonas sp.]|nr:Mth938-like domain-containing protein [Sphingomonas sp.]
MARMDREPKPEGPVVQGFSGSGFVVDGRVYRALLLTPQGAHEWDAPLPAALAARHLETVLALQPQPEFLLLGTGASLTFPPRALVREIEARGIGVEAMDSRAAARIWGLLRGEERWIVAALMPLG